jgi:DNA-binding protein HU-beta
MSMVKKARRTTHRSTAGKKLYAVRDASGRFKDIQTYERAHRADLAKKSKAEIAKAKKKAARKTSGKRKAVKKR